MEPLAYVHHPTWPLLEGRKPQHIFVTWRWGMGVGVWAPNFLKGQHRDSNPGHPACESGFVAITLRRPPKMLNFLFNSCLEPRTYRISYVSYEVPDQFWD